MTRKTIFSLGGVAILCLSFAFPGLSYSGPETSPTARTQPNGQMQSQAAHVETNDINGHAWMVSSNDSKLSFLLGVENAIAMECAMIDAKAARDGHKAEYSHFQQGWMSAFDKTSRQQIADSVNAFYTAHPNQKDRHVFDVIWSEMIVPAQQIRR